MFKINHFDPEIEHQYRLACSLRTLILIRYGIATGVILFVLTAVFEIFILRSMQNIQLAWVTAIGSGLAIALLGALSYVDFFQKNSGILVSIAAIIITFNNLFDFPLYYEQGSYSFIFTQLIGLYILSVVAPNLQTVLTCSFIVVFLPIPMASLLSLEGIITANGYYYLIMIVGTICVMSYFLEIKKRQSYRLELELSKERENMKELAIRDELTGCYNRRHFYDAFSKEWSRTKRNSSQFGIIMIDVDNFKLINDNYGHGTGDKVLEEIAQVCQTELRTEDTLARIGGEEFALLLIKPDKQGALEVAERIRKKIELIRLTINHDENISVTVSMGLTLVDAKAGLSLDEILQQADEAMYKSKNNGRNRVTMYQQETGID